MIVTSTPNDRQADANSTPMTPPPSTIAFSGSVVELQRVLARQHPDAVDLEAGQRLRVRAGGQDDVPALVADAVHLDALRARRGARGPSMTVIFRPATSPCSPL